MTASRSERTAGAAPGLSRERVLRTAIDLADDLGIESLTMRNLAQRLDVGVMSMYYHVRDKDDIIDGIVDLVVAEFDLPPSEGEWRVAVRRGAISAHEALLRHPWAAGLMFSAADGPARIRYMEWLLGTIRRAGFSADVTHRAYHALDSHIIGFTMWETSIPFTDQELPEIVAAFLEDLPAEDYPYLMEHIEQHLSDPDEDEIGAFEFGLDLILDSLDRSRP